MIVNGNSLLEAEPLSPMYEKKLIHEKSNTSYGLTECGYDIRIAEDVWMFLGCRFRLSFSLEKFRMPNHLMGRVLNKSTWARRGIDASMTTNIEPGWCGWLTIEISYKKWWPIYIPAGVGICQVIFETLEQEAEYDGKYANQPDRPVPAKY